MKPGNSHGKFIGTGALLVACSMIAMMCGSASRAYAQSPVGEPNRLTPPPLPDGLEVPDDEHAFLVGHATGTQNYVCVPAGSGFAFNLFTPQATLFTDEAHQVTTHFFSPNPQEKGVVRATWEDSRDTSTVWGKVVAQSSDAPFVKQGAIAWLKVEITGAVAGPTGGRTLTPTLHILRVNTDGGSAPADQCVSAADVGKKVFVPYTADYFFFARHTDQGREK